MPRNDTWDWPVLLYVGTVILKRTERQFWRMSPRKLNALTDAHIDLNSQNHDSKKQDIQTGYIDQVI
jgi:uncharacterized phage protein (TIGR02216 family)